MSLSLLESAGSARKYINAHWTMDPPFVPVATRSEPALSLGPGGEAHPRWLDFNLPTGRARSAPPAPLGLGAPYWPPRADPYPPRLPEPSAACSDRKRAVSAAARTISATPVEVTRA